MDASDPIVMDDDERDEFLDTGGTGVISLVPTESGPPHAIPVSYGYDAAARTFYFRLAVDPDSEKGDLAGRPATFVAYGRDDGQWRSVVARGRLESTTGESIGTETLEGLEAVHIPLVDIFGRPPRQVPFEFYRLAPDDLTGRKESTTDV